MSDNTREQTLWAPRAWVKGRWQEAVRLDIGADGRWSAITPNTTCPDGVQPLPGPLLPGLVNAHSHAFQRAFAGLAERRESAHDDFWSWRERMYAVALRIAPEQLFAVARQLYAELLAGGYTHTVEFHYLHHQADGRPYAEAATLARALADAARAVGMGLTLLPVLYERAGFQHDSLRAEQRRFATSVASVLALRDTLRAWRLPQVHAGVAVHSLRAARPDSIRMLAAACQGDAGPIHIHVAEQTAEVQDCIEHTGRRPVQWLLDQGLLDARWQLVHATHTLASEVSGTAATGAGVVICPSTEANLGDGLCELPAWLASGTPLSIGSDSHICRAWTEELRWLEYGQRLAQRQRNVAAEPAHEPSTAARLFERVLAGGAAAAALGPAGLVPGARADALLLDPADPALAGLPLPRLLDALVFSAPSRPFARVWVAGRGLEPATAAAAAAPGMHSALQALHRD